MNDSNLLKLGHWADTPYPLIETPKHKVGKTGYSDPHMEVASELCVVHNAVLPGLTSIYIQGPNIQPADYVDFIGLASEAWRNRVVQGHERGSREALGPESFPSGLDEFKKYLEGLSGKESTLDAAHLNGIIVSFAPAFCDHLSSEVDSLLALSKYGAKLPIEDLRSKEGKHTVTAMTKFSVLPFFFLNLDITYEEYPWKTWPAVPGAVKWVFTHSFTMWNNGYWKFASCDQSGKSKALYWQGTSK